LVASWNAAVRERGNTLLYRRSFLRLALSGAIGSMVGCGSRVRQHPAGSAAVWVERESYLMGTLLRGLVAAPTREAGLEALEHVFDAVRRLEAVLSTWRSDTQMSLLNSSPAGVAVSVSPELAALLGEVWTWSEATAGAFDPAVGALIDAWDLRGAGRRPSASDLEGARRASGLGRFEWVAGSGTVKRQHADAWIDTGAFGKGATLREAEQVLRDRGIETALLDFGGQVLTLGSPGEQNGWPVAGEHPSERQDAVTSLRLRDRSAATSSASERFVEPDGERLGHILDPRTGRPVPAWGSVTVVAADAMAADVLSTALFVLGPEEGMQFAATLEDIGALFLVEQDGALDARWNAALEPYRVAGSPL
jgi:thiamine biosynthesis lipoprotein